MNSSSRPGVLEKLARGEARSPLVVTEFQKANPAEPADPANVAESAPFFPPMVAGGVYPGDPTWSGAAAIGNPEAEAVRNSTAWGKEWELTPTRHKEGKLAGKSRAIFLGPSAGRSRPVAVESARSGRLRFQPRSRRGRTERGAIGESDDAQIPFAHEAERDETQGHSREAADPRSSTTIRRSVTRCGACKKARRVAIPTPPTCFRTRRPSATSALAALFHDLGHGPLSHAWEREIVGEDYDQEAWRRGLGLADDPALSRRLKWHVLVGQAFLSWESGELHRVLESYETGTSRRLRAFLLGSYYLAYLPKLLDGDVDVDRGDFLKRDGHQCGVTYGDYDLPRLVSTCTLGKTEEGELAVGFERAKAVRVVEQFLIARRAMYDAVYHHRTVRAAEGMVALFLRRLKTVARGGSAWGVGVRDRIVEPLMKMVAGQVVGPEELLSADDFSLQVLIGSAADDLDADPTARDLANRIASRRLFKSVPVAHDRLSDYLQRPTAYQEIDSALRESGFNEPEFYRVVDKVRFRMLADRKQERSYFVSVEGVATPIAEHESIRSVWDGRTHEQVRLMVPEEAVDRVAKVIGKGR